MAETHQRLPEPTAPASSTRTFHPFSRLPPEIRLMIWEDALMSDWSVVAFDYTKDEVYVRPHIKPDQQFGLVGINARSTPAIGHVCYEAREAMKKRCIKVHSTWNGGDRFIGWFYMPRTLFYIPDFTLYVDSDHNNRMLRSVVDMLQDAQHLVFCQYVTWIPPHIKRLQRTAKSMKTLTLITSWSGSSDKWTGGWDLYQQKQNLHEIDWAPLLRDIEQPRDVTTAQSQLHHYTQSLPPRGANGLLMRLDSKWFTRWPQIPAGQPTPIIFPRTPYQIKASFGRGEWETEWEEGKSYPSWVHGGLMQAAEDQTAPASAQGI